MAKTWDEIRAVRYSPLTPPPEWPSNVRPISNEGVSLLGIDPATNHLYWDGKQVVLRDRVVTLDWAAVPAWHSWRLFVANPVAWQNFYKTARWRRLRKFQLIQHLLCKFCLERGIVTAANVVDHVEPHKGDWTAFVTGKLQSLCGPCHKSAKRQIELRGYRCDIGLDGLPTIPIIPSTVHARPLDPLPATRVSEGKSVF